MLQVKKVNENYRQSVVNLLKADIIRHVFAVYDLQYDFEHTIMYASFKNDKLNGYILIYTALDFPSAILESDVETAETLVTYAPRNHFIIHCPPELLSPITERFPNEKHYVEDWMIVHKDETSFFKSENVKRLCTLEDGSKLAALLSTREDRPKTTAKKCYDLISRMPTYGVFMNGELISYAGSFIHLPQIWLIGGVYTHPNHRNKGYATLATSTVTEEALRNADTAALFVRIDNIPAIRAYEKIGYKKIGEKLWVDIGTGMMP
jgi:RimJ/RimL family protein N-acetyltransferase